MLSAERALAASLRSAPFRSVPFSARRRASRLLHTCAYATAVYGPRSIEEKAGGIAPVGESTAYLARALQALHRKAIESGFIFRLDLYSPECTRARARVYTCTHTRSTVIICGRVSPQAACGFAFSTCRAGYGKRTATAARVSRGFRNMQRDGWMQPPRRAGLSGLLFPLAPSLGLCLSLGGI